MERLVKVVAIIRVLYIVYLAFEAYNMTKSRRRWWVRPVNLTREELGFFASCTSQLKDKDEEHFFKATRMSVAKFQFLLSLIKGRLERFSIRKPIQPEVRLTLTLFALFLNSTGKSLLNADAMGAQKSTLSEEQLDEYVQLSYLAKSTILHIYKKLSTIESCNLESNLSYRFTKEEILDQFPELRHNPYSDQIFKIFSSEKDDKLSFEDVIDLCSVFSEQCPLKVKASWAFKIFDFDEDNQISKEDLFETINRLTHPLLLFKHEKEGIADVLLEEMDLQHTGSMSQMEFVHAITKMPEFALVFSFKA